jgi:hypothetical protein
MKNRDKPTPQRLKAPSEMEWLLPYAARLEQLTRAVCAVSRNRQEKYEDAPLFFNAWTQLKYRLKKKRPDAEIVVKFIRWFDPLRHGYRDVAKQLKELPPSAVRDIEDYVSFLYRFRIRVAAKLLDPEHVELTPEFPAISNDVLIGQLRRGRFDPIGRTGPYEEGEVEEEYLDNLADTAGLSEVFIEELRKKRPFRFLTLRVPDAAAEKRSELLWLLDTFYDPLHLNFVLVERQIASQKGYPLTENAEKTSNKPRAKQHYLICIIGELSDSKSWDLASKVRTQAIKHFHGSSPRGRKPNRRQQDANNAALLKEDENIEAATYQTVKAAGLDYGTANERTVRKYRESVRRSQKIVAQKSPDRA